MNPRRGLTPRPQMPAPSSLAVRWPAAARLPGICICVPGCAPRLQPVETTETPHVQFLNKAFLPHIVRSRPLLPMLLNDDILRLQLNLCSASLRALDFDVNLNGKIWLKAGSKRGPVPLDVAEGLAQSPRSSKRLRSGLAGVRGGSPRPGGSSDQQHYQQQRQRPRPPGEDGGGGGAFARGGSDSDHGKRHSGLGQPDSPRRSVLPLKFVIPRD